jgi:hypothetical protein
MQRFSAELRELFPNRSATFEIIEQLTGQWEARFRQYCEVVQGEFELFRQTEQATARYMVASHGANLASRVVNLSNGVVLLLNRRNVHSVGAVARAQFESCAAAVYGERRLVPLLKKRRSDEVHRLLYRLGQGTHPASGVGHWRAIGVPSLIKAMKQEADELMAPTVAKEGLPAEAEGEPYSAAIANVYGWLSEFTHPNLPALSLSMTEDDDWVLQPPVSAQTLGHAVRPVMIGLLVGGKALDRLMDTAKEYPMQLPNIEPEFPPEHRHS